MMTWPPASAIRSMLGETELPQSMMVPAAMPRLTAPHVIYSGSHTPAMRPASPSMSMIEACTEE